MRELNIPNLTKSNWKERFWYIKMEPEKVAMDHPNIKNNHIEAVALWAACSTTYMGKTKAAKELRAAAMKRYNVWIRWIMEQYFLQSSKKIGPKPFNPTKTPYYCGVEVRQ